MLKLIQPTRSVFICSQTDLKFKVTTAISTQAVQITFSSPSQNLHSNTPARVNSFILAGIQNAISFLQLSKMFSLIKGGIIMRHLLQKVLAAIFIFYAFSANANELVLNYPEEKIVDTIVEDIEHIGAVCRIGSVDERIDTSLARIQEMVQCGRTQEAYKESIRLTKRIEQLMDNSGDLGTCWEDRNCSGTVLKIMVTKSACKDLLGGKSWQQKRPEQGLCINL